MSEPLPRRVPGTELSPAPDAEDEAARAPQESKGGGVLTGISEFLLGHDFVEKEANCPIIPRAVAG